ncbi:hypothetical protein TWF696_000667 [Orbilia brochopaga]|uniref:Nonribosomal peptide synthetase 12 n=1 Tax=Orbilia brochopaga TaxID=3140254 RepID=A0AAV9VF07_9PEZI
MSDTTPAALALTEPKIVTDAVVSKLQGCEGVSEAAVIEIEGRIHAFITPDTVDVQLIEKQLASELDEKLRPASYNALSQMPYTLRGRIDEGALETWLKGIKSTQSTEHLLAPPRVHIKEVRSGSTASSSSLSSIYSGHGVQDRASWDDYLESQLPNKVQPKPVRNLRYIGLIIYRRIFSVIFIANMIPFLLLLIKGTDCPTLATACSINLLIAICIRQDNVVNALFRIAGWVPRSWPLWIRKNAAKVYHLGGIHSGCAASATFWFGFLVVQASFDAFRTSPLDSTRKTISAATLGVAYVIMLLFTMMLSFAYPSVRRRIHNQFEQVHRFSGWTVLILFWILNFMLITDYTAPNASITRATLKTPGFWCLIIITISIASPWMHLRKVTVIPEKLSNHAIRLHFNYRQNPVPGSFVRLSDTPLMEWHSFATIAVPDRSGFSVVVSRAGDWTSKYINSPPTRMWIRGVPTRGVMNVAHFFNSAVIVGTGSGIGPCLPVLLAAKNNGIKVRVLWSTPKPQETFGDEIVNGVLAADPKAIIWDTRAHGKPDMVKLVWGLVQESKAEAVVIISNPALTKKVVYGMETRGVPAYGAIWDS